MLTRIRLTGSKSYLKQSTLTIVLEGIQILLSWVKVPLTDQPIHPDLLPTRTFCFVEYTFRNEASACSEFTLCLNVIFFSWLCLQQLSFPSISEGSCNESSSFRSPALRQRCCFVLILFSNKSGVFVFCLLCLQKAAGSNECSEECGESSDEISLQEKISAI